MRPHLLLATLVLCACNVRERGARDDFATRYSCPTDRIVTKQRTDLPLPDAFGGPDHAQPSAEIAADPERLAKFKKDHEGSALAASWNGYEIYDVSGCGHTEQLACRRGHRGIWCEQNKTPP